MWKELSLEAMGSEQLFQGRKQLYLNPSPFLWLDFSPVTRGVGGQAWLSSERQQSQPTPVGFTLLRLHFPAAWV